MTGGEWSDFWVTSSGVECLHAHYQTHVFEAHEHPEYVVALIEAGTERCRHRGVTQVAGPGSVCVVNPGAVHTGGSLSEGGYTYRSLYPTLEMMQRAGQQILGTGYRTPYFVMDIIDDAEVALALLTFHRLDDTTQLAKEAHFYDLVRLLLERYSEGRSSVRPVRSERHAVRRAEDYLRDHPVADVSLSHLAAHVGLNPYSLLQSFRLERGLTPHAFQMNVRAELSKDALRRGATPVEAATQTGFVGARSLGRVFRRVYGISPEQYREAVHP